MTYRSHGYLSLHCNCGLDIDVPEGYEQDTIRCIRCGSVLPIPAAASTLDATSSTLHAAPPLLYQRSRQGWESFRCACGRTVQLSPTFSAPSIHCNGCGRTIQIS